MFYYSLMFLKILERLVIIMAWILQIISAPGLAWDAMLMMTGIELEQIHDPRVLDIIERHKKGGLCFVGARRHVKANNNYLENFDPTKPESYLLYWDANNLYGWAMSQYLPYKNLRLNTDVSIDQVLETADDSDVGYIIECDLNAPKNTSNIKAISTVSRKYGTN